MIRLWNWMQKCCFPCVSARFSRAPSYFVSENESVVPKTCYLGENITLQRINSFPVNNWPEEISAPPTQLTYPLHRWSFHTPEDAGTSGASCSTPPRTSDNRQARVESSPDNRYSTDDRQIVGTPTADSCMEISHSSDLNRLMRTGTFRALLLRFSPQTRLFWCTPDWSSSIWTVRTRWWL